jgi:hypothetical protein
VAEQERLAKIQQAAASGSDVIGPIPTPESVKDMSNGTRRVLERISDLLRQARPLSPDDGGVTAPENAEPQPNIADIEGEVAESVNDHPID